MGIYEYYEWIDKCDLVNRKKNVPQKDKERVFSRR